MQNIIAAIEAETAGKISTWFVPSDQCLKNVIVKGAHSCRTLCKLSDTEFFVGSDEGHLCFMAHVEGCGMKELKRIWKAHRKALASIYINQDIILSTGADCTDRLCRLN